MLMDVSTSRVISRHSTVSWGWADVAGDEVGHRRDEWTTMRTSISDSGGNQWRISKVRSPLRSFSSFRYSPQFSPQFWMPSIYPAW